MKPSLLTLLTAAACCGALVSCHRADKSAAAEEVPPVEVAEVVTDSVTLYKDYPGILIADRTVKVVCRTDGTVSRPLYTAGDYVKAGQLLFTVDAPLDINAEAEAVAALATARSENEYAENHYAAVAKALESNAVSKMEVAEALSNRDQSRAAIKNAEAALASARTRLGYSRITAPVSGHISDNEVSGGSYVTGSAQPVLLATIYDDAVLQASFAIEDESFQHMFLDPANRAKLDYSAIPLKFAEPLPHEYTADLTYLAPNIDSSTGTMNLKANIDNPYNELKSGMYLTLHMPYDTAPHAMLVLDASVGTDQLGNYIYVVNDSNRIVYTPVKTGDTVADTLRIVTSGVRPGTRYVKSALLKVRDGMEVKPVEAAPAAATKK